MEQGVFKLYIDSCLADNIEDEDYVIDYIKEKTKLNYFAWEISKQGELIVYNIENIVKEKN